MPQPGRAERAGSVPGPDEITESRYRMAPVGTQAMQAGHGRLAWKNSTRLADGREIIYFDEAPELNRVQARDLREGLAKVPGPDEVSPEQSLRWDPLLGEWVVIAAARQERTFLGGQVEAGYPGDEGARFHEGRLSSRCPRGQGNSR